MQIRHSTKIIVGLSVISALALTGCSSAGSPAPSSSGASAAAGTFDAYGVTVSPDAQLRAMLPADVITKNQLVFSTAGLQPPRAFIDEKGNLVGVIPDLLKAVGAEFGVPVEVRQDPFDTQVPGVQSGRFDATTDTADLPTRRAVFDMVDFFGGGWAYMTVAGNPKNITDDPMTQCGLKVGLLQGGTLIQPAQDLSAKCVAAGKSPLDIQIFNAVQLAVPLQAGRVDVVWDGAAGCVYLAKSQPDKFAIAGKVKPIAYAAFGVNKDRPEFSAALQAALQKLIDTGAYASIAHKWDSDDFIISKITMNTDVPATN